MRKYLPTLIALLVVLSVNLYFRSFPVNFPQLKKQARDMVTDGIRKQAQQHVYQKFPQYDPLANERLVREEIINYKKYNKKEYLQQVDDLYRRLKDRYQDNRGQTYLMELDCWHWSQYVKNVVDHGYPGDTIKDGRQVDSRMLAPHGDFLPWSQFNFYFPAFLYKLWSSIRYVPLFTFLFYLPLFYTAILVVVLYLFSRRCAGTVGAVLSTLFIGLSAIFIPRSSAGWFDMDILNIALPIAIIWAYINGITSIDLKKKIAWLVFSGLLVGLFCFTWTTWWFILAIIIGYHIISMGWSLFLARRDRSRLKSTLIRQSFALGVFSLSGIIFAVLLSGFEPLGVLYRDQIMQAFALNKPLIPSIWPNVYSTVGELRKIEFKELAQSLGGPSVAVLSFVCLIAVFIRALIGRAVTGFRRISAFIFVLWFFGMLYATYRGVRFTMFLIVPLGIFLGWGIHDASEYFLSRIKPWQRFISVYAVVAAISMVLWGYGYKSASSVYPLMHDRWYEVLIAIKERTPPDTVVNSWWDFGDWFKVVAERPVIFDGQSQNTPQAFWMGKAMLSHDEKESIGILRMLNNGGNDAFELINEYIDDPLQSALLLESMVSMDELQARGLLSDFIPQSAVNQVLVLLFDEPPNAEFVVDYSLVYKISAISYLGNWNFAKVYMVQNYNRMEKERIIDRLAKLGKDRSLMQKYYQEMVLIPTRELSNWLSLPVQYFSTVIHGQQEGDAVIFENGFVYKPKEQIIRANDGKIPRSLFLKQGSEIIELVYPNPGLVFSVLIWENEQGYWAVLLDPTLGRALFTKLYFLDGLGSQHFQPHIRGYDGGNFIGTYKINW